MERSVSLVDYPTVDSLATKWSPVNHRLGTGQRKSASQRPTPQPQSYADNA